MPDSAAGTVPGNDLTAAQLRTGSGWRGWRGQRRSVQRPDSMSRTCYECSQPGVGRHSIELLEMFGSVPVWALVLNPQPSQFLPKWGVGLTAGLGGVSLNQKIGAQKNTAIRYNACDMSTCTRWATVGGEGIAEASSSVPVWALVAISLFYSWWRECMIQTDQVVGGGSGREAWTLRERGAVGLAGLVRTHQAARGCVERRRAGRESVAWCSACFHPAQPSSPTCSLCSGSLSGCVSLKFVSRHARRVRDAALGLPGLCARPCPRRVLGPVQRAVCACWWCGWAHPALRRVLGPCTASSAWRGRRTGPCGSAGLPRKPPAARTH